MGRPKNTSRETQQHFHAWEIYRDLGPIRSYRSVSRRVSCSVTSVSKWARDFEWDKRLQVYEQNVVERTAADKETIAKAENPLTGKIFVAMERMEAMIGSAFTLDANGKMEPKIEIRHVEELTKCLMKYRKLIETCQQFMAETGPKANEKGMATNIKQMNVTFESMSQADRIKTLNQIGATSGNVPGGDSGPKGGVQEADYTEVPERGNEDGPGCEGVPGSTPSGKGGDKA